MLFANIHQDITTHGFYISCFMFSKILFKDINFFKCLLGAKTGKVPSDE